MWREYPACVAYGSESTWRLWKQRRCLFLHLFDFENISLHYRFSNNPVAHFLLSIP
jgi:hypothetical protein